MLKKFCSILVVFVSFILIMNLLGKIYQSYCIKTNEIDYAVNQIFSNKSEKTNKSEIKETEKYPGINKLMIVAHPDDETFWGGAHLIEDNYLVVCITCGTVSKRVEEFRNAMIVSRDEYIMLGYPDLTNGKKDDWSKSYSKIKKSLEKIINYKNWDMIVTHNPVGEYGHIHHKMTSGMVTELADGDSLYYFGYYFSKNGIKSVEGMNTISSESRKIKVKKMIPVYSSQVNAKNMFEHMFDYENFVFNKDWNLKL